MALSESEPSILEMVQALQIKVQEQSEELHRLHEQNELILQQNSQLLTESRARQQECCQLRTENAQLQHRLEVYRQEIERLKRLNNGTSSGRSGCCCINIFRIIFPCCDATNGVAWEDEHTISQERQQLRHHS